MQEYLDISEQLLKCPVRKNRTGIDTTGKVFNHMEFDTNYGSRFSAVTSKSLMTKGVFGELWAFWRGATDAAVFGALGCNVWYENANKHGVNPNPWLSNPFRKGENDLGPVYGKQWRKWDDTRIICVGVAGPDYNTHLGRQTPTFDFVHDAYVPKDGEVLGEEPKIFEQLRYMKKSGYIKVAEFMGPNAEINYIMHREVDQLKNVVESIVKTPNNRRMIISSWNPSDLDKMALPPCHVLQHYLCTELTLSQRVEAHVQKIVSESLWFNSSHISQKDCYLDVHSRIVGSGDWTEERLDAANAPKFRLDLVMFQRSVDWILGAPFNISSYDAMINIMAHITNTAPGSLHYLTSDTHLYATHVDAAHEQIERGPEPTSRARLLINPRLKTIEDCDTANLDDIRLIDYVHKGKLVNPTPMAV